MAKPKKADVVAELEAKGIAFDPESTVDELIALLPKDEEEAEDGGAEEVESKGGKGTATVYSKTGNPVRTYTKEVHGAGYKKSADEYAKKIGGTAK